MKTAKTIEELQDVINAFGQNKTIGFTPTMGYLHEGHLSLIQKARTDNDIVIVSIFVNPTQFGPGEDFKAYPRNFDRDSRLAEAAGADILFVPDVSEIYPEGSTTFVLVEGVSTKKMCGSSRPTHFKGVTTVVNILFNIIKPDKAYFGQKDAQQVEIIKKMVRDLHMQLTIVTCPIIREADGLAMSSRNVYLSPEERNQALILNKSLKDIQGLYRLGETKVETLKTILRNGINTMPLAVIDYVEILDLNTLDAIEKIEAATLAAVAVRFGNTRLIDNIILE
ncbi:pantoate--beta-alanine ligase [Acetobacterium bakii]|uniref:Pantothenate synthetase n=1 Tax=Acetobacterium bakii TaxID=52689 RepID=A0A0L6TZK5_9FIRM|nr:pantoate--beta-alanine ligase [Acetobacterium bakii]KNZ41512.1 pantoate--beta-alanine ligase [Acetobacterium bakii]